MSGLFLEFSEFPALRHVGDFTNWVGNLMESEAVCMCVCVHARVRTNSIRAGVFFFFLFPPSCSLFLILFGLVTTVGRKKLSMQPFLHGPYNQKNKQGVS